MLLLLLLLLLLQRASALSASHFSPQHYDARVKFAQRHTLIAHVKNLAGKRPIIEQGGISHENVPENQRKLKALMQTHHMACWAVCVLGDAVDTDRDYAGVDIAYENKGE